MRPTLLHTSRQTYRAFARPNVCMFAYKRRTSRVYYVILYHQLGTRAEIVCYLILIDLLRNIERVNT